MGVPPTVLLTALHCTTSEQKQKSKVQNKYNAHSLCFSLFRVLYNTCVCLLYYCCVCGGVNSTMKLEAVKQSLFSQCFAKPHSPCMKQREGGVCQEHHSQKGHRITQCLAEKGTGDPTKGKAQSA